MVDLAEKIELAHRAEEGAGRYNVKLRVDQLPMHSIFRWRSRSLGIKYTMNGDQAILHRLRPSSIARRMETKFACENTAPYLKQNLRFRGDSRHNAPNRHAPKARLQFH